MVKDYPTIADYEQLRSRDPTSVFDSIKSSLLSTVPSIPRKTVRAHIEIRNIILNKLHLFEQKDRIEDIDNI